MAAVFLAGSRVMNASETQGEKSTVATPTPADEKSEREKRLAIATEAARQRLLTMDTDKSGKVSKQEWMKFMEEEFDRLDVNHGGELER
jgi:EF hand